MVFYVCLRHLPPPLTRHRQARQVSPPPGSRSSQGFRNLAFLLMVLSSVRWGRAPSLDLTWATAGGGGTARTRARLPWGLEAAGVASLELEYRAFIIPGWGHPNEAP